MKPQKKPQKKASNLDATIVKSIQRFAVPIDSLHTHPKNARQGDVGAISQSLEAHRQYRCIVFQQSSHRILAGNHTWLAAKALGWSHIAATPVVCDDVQALRILVADNRANDLASYDDAGMVDLLSELAATDLGLAGTLYDADDLERLISDLDEPLQTTKHIEFDVEIPDPNAPCKLCGRSPLDDDPNKPKPVPPVKKSRKRVKQ